VNKFEFPKWRGKKFVEAIKTATVFSFNSQLRNVSNFAKPIYGKRLPCKMVDSHVANSNLSTALPANTIQAGTGRKVQLRLRHWGDKKCLRFVTISPYKK